MKPPLLEMPSRDVVRFADVKKGGGIEYSGPMIPLEKYPEFITKQKEACFKVQPIPTQPHHGSSQGGIV